MNLPPNTTTLHIADDAVMHQFAKQHSQTNRTTTKETIVTTIDMLGNLHPYTLLINLLIVSTQPARCLLATAVLPECDSSAPWATVRPTRFLVRHSSPSLSSVSREAAHKHRPT